MNTIEEIIKEKGIRTEEIYSKIICSECKNRKNKRDLCKITRRVDKTVRCDNYERFIKNEHKKKKIEFITAKQNKPIMRGLV